MEDNAVVEPEEIIPEYKRIATECAEAIKDSRRFVEGTEFVGFNRADLRERGKRNDPKVPGSLASVRPVTHEIVKSRLARQLAKDNEDVVRPLFPNYPMPMAPGVRAELYGDNPTPAQRRRFRKKTHKMFKDAS